MAKSSCGGGWRTGGGDKASILTVRNTKTFRLNNVKDCSWSRNIITTCYSDQDMRSKISYIFLQTKTHVYDIMYQELKNMNRSH